VISAFDALFQVFNNTGDEAGILGTAAKGLSHTFDLAAFSALTLYTSLLRILRVAPLVAEALTFNNVDFNSKGFTDAIEKTEQLMEDIANRFLKKFEPEIVLPTVKKPRQTLFRNLLGTDEEKKKAQSEVDNFFENLTKQIDQINQKTIELKVSGEAGQALGEQAGLAAALNQQFKRLKESLGAKVSAFPGLEEKFLSFRDRILNVNQELLKFKAQAELKDLDIDLKLGAIDTTTPQGAAQQRIAEITVAFARMGKKIDELGRQAELDQDQIAARIGLAWKKSLAEISEAASAEFKKLDPSFRSLQKTLAIEIMPPEEREWARISEEFESRIEAIDKWRQAAIAAGEDVEGVMLEAAQAVKDAWTAAEKEMNRPLETLATRQAQAEKLALALGKSFDLVSEKIAIQRQRIEELTKQYDALSPEVQEAVAELRRLEEEQVGMDLFRSLADSLDRGIMDTLRGIREGSQSLGEGLKNLVRNMAISLQEELLRLTLLNPLKNWLMDLFDIQGARAPTLDLGKIFGKIFGIGTARAPATTPTAPITPESFALTQAGGALGSSYGAKRRRSSFSFIAGGKRRRSGQRSR
jgi:hypothetical protein